MDTLIKGVVIAVVAILFVNVLLLGFPGLSGRGVSLGTRLMLEAFVVLFILFMYFATKKR